MKPITTVIAGLVKWFGSCYTGEVMNSFKQKIILGMFLSFLVVPNIATALTMKISQKDFNDWGISGTDLSYANFNDCESNVYFEFTVDLENADVEGRDLYLYMSDDSDVDCSTDPTDCEILVSNQNSSNLTFEVSTQKLFGDACVEGKVYIWTALLESENQTVADTGALWPDNYSADITLDTTGPSVAPTNISGISGSKKVTVNWSAPDSEDVAGYVVVYRAGASVSSDDAGALECTVEGGFVAGDDYSPSLVTDKNTSAIDSASTLSITIDGLTNGVSYNFAVVSTDEAGNPSKISETVCVIPENTVNFADLYSNGGGKGDGEFCFIATAAFGSYDHPAVRVLRVFRDSFLMNLPGGQLIVEGYYAVGPAMAEYVGSHAALRELLIQILLIFAGFTMLLMSIGTTGVMTGIGSSILIGVLVGSRGFLRRRNR